MTTALQDEVAAFYAHYLAAWNNRDYAALADCFALPATFVSTVGTVCASDRTKLLLQLERTFDRLEADGFDHSELGSLETRRCGEGLAVADASAVRRLRADGSLQECIDAHYVLRREPAGWRFVISMSCTPGWRQV
jgi:ketosteroid isomerase-like protein